MIRDMRKVLRLISLLIFLPGILFAECLHFPTGRELGVDDGAGTYGPLDGTMRVDCLSMISTYQLDGIRFAILVDDRGESYYVAEGDYIGHPHGSIKKITPDTIYYYHYYEKEDGSWHEGVRKLPCTHPYPD